MSAEDYTPDTEHVRHDYAYDGYLEAPLVQLEDQFDRWHAAEIRTARVKELREVADFIQEVRGRYWSTDDEMASLELDRECVEQMSAWLYHRADSIEAAS